jgi:hypothetical protein
MVKKFSIEEVPVENNIPLEPLLPQGASNDAPRKQSSGSEDKQSSGSEGKEVTVDNTSPEHSSGNVSPEQQKSPYKKELLPTITVTTANGDHVITRLKRADDKEGDDTKILHYHFICKNFLYS